ncbi:hypothetical protein [Nostoc sp. UHCC 0252]|uniref:hypothetical protein n=1 Tax=Nostoc sp. UHCC 0252 TaxID=3110241 RepID=UPI002B21DCC6|nr:hypothetical protein [Nostoc sp. UHCC 0252]MEA5602718.1 hypothetical protein [Nostoc sp. UHCC 0252]
MEFFNDNIAIALLFYRHSSDRIHKNTTGDRTIRSAIALNLNSCLFVLHTC